MGRISTEFEKYCDLIRSAKNATPGKQQELAAKLPAIESSFQKALGEVGEGQRDALDKLAAKAAEAWAAAIEFNL